MGYTRHVQSLSLYIKLNFNEVPTAHLISESIRQLVSSHFHFEGKKIATSLYLFPFSLFPFPRYQLQFFASCASREQSHFEMEVKLVKK